MLVKDLACAARLEERGSVNLQSNRCVELDLIHRIEHLYQVNHYRLLRVHCDKRQQSESITLMNLCKSTGRRARYKASTAPA